jgi:periplasmic protein TonB
MLLSTVLLLASANFSILEEPQKAGVAYMATKREPPAVAKYGRFVIPVRPKSNPGDWATQDDYPLEALENEWEGVTAFKLDVDVNGDVTRCEVTSSSSHAALDNRTCDLLLSRAKFYPAKDAKGRAVSSTYSNRIRWEMPEGVPEKIPATGKMSVTYTIEKDGSASGCEAKGNLAILGTADDGSGLCDNLSGFEIPLDAAGEPTRKKVVLVVNLLVTDIKDGE